MNVDFIKSLSQNNKIDQIYLYLFEKDNAVRKQVCLELVKHQHTKTLCNFLKDPVEEIREIALQGLNKGKDLQSIYKFIYDPSPRIRCLVVRILSKYSCLAKLEQMTKDGQKEVKLQAYHELLRHGKKELVTHAFLQERSPYRQADIISLLEDREYLPFLREQAYTHPHYLVRIKCCIIFKKHHQYTEVIRISKDKNYLVRKEAIKALGTLKMVNEILGHQSDEDPDVREQVIEELKKFNKEHLVRYDPTQNTRDPWDQYGF